MLLAAELATLITQHEASRAHSRVLPPGRMPRHLHVNRQSRERGSSAAAEDQHLDGLAPFTIGNRVVAHGGAGVDTAIGEGKPHLPA